MGRFTVCEDYFTPFQPSQSYGGVKTEDLREKPSDHTQAELGLSHVIQAGLEPTPVRMLQ